MMEAAVMKFYDLSWGRFSRRVTVYMQEKGIDDVEIAPPMLEPEDGSYLTDEFPNQRRLSLEVRRSSRKRRTRTRSRQTLLVAGSGEPAARTPGLTLGYEEDGHPLATLHMPRVPFDDYCDMRGF